MTIWILAVLLVASGAGMGLRQGAIRAVFSFLGIVFAALLAAPAGHIFKALMPHLGLSNPTLLWMITPIEGFVLVLVLFKAGGFFVHRKVSVHYKYQVGELQRLLWERMNSRLGACVGVLNGAAYLVLVCFVIYNLSYWTVQVGTSDAEPKTLRLINKLGEDLDSTGMARPARAVATLPNDYYKVADLAGLIFQNPDVSERLGSYPAFISLAERDDFQQLTQSSDVTNAFQTHAPVGQMIDLPAVQNILKNTDLMNTVWMTIETNLDDLTNYLQTGKSPKYDSEKIVGRWDFNANVTLAMLRVSRPTITSAEMRGIRALWTAAFEKTTFVAGTDAQAFLKNLPDFKKQPPAPQTWTGSWTEEGSDYGLTLTADGENKSMTAKISNDRLTLADDKNTFIFDRE